MTEAEALETAGKLTAANLHGAFTYLPAELFRTTNLLSGARARQGDRSRGAVRCPRAAPGRRGPGGRDRRRVPPGRSAPRDIAVDYGAVIGEVARQVRTQITDDLGRHTGLTVAEVNVHVVNVMVTGARTDRPAR